MKIGLLTIATNKYINFVSPLYESADSYFCQNHEVFYFLFTNHERINIKTKRNIIPIKINHEPWPNMTLKRYHFFSSNKSKLEMMDYVYYCDADMKFVAPISDEIISDRVVTVHPGFYNKPRKNYPYEKKKNSTAYVAPNKGTKYYAGGFNGGKSSDFLIMSNHIVQKIDLDLKVGIVAEWHDESHLNNYYAYHSNPTLELSPSYCYPEKWNLPFTKKLLALDKNHKEIRK